MLVRTAQLPEVFEVTTAVALDAKGVRTIIELLVIEEQVIVILPIDPEAVIVVPIFPDTTLDELIFAAAFGNKVAKVDPANGAEAVDELPLKDAVIVPAEKLPEESRKTIVDIVFVLDGFPASLLFEIAAEEDISASTIEEPSDNFE